MIYEQLLKWVQINNIPFTSDETLSSTNDLAKEQAFHIADPLHLYFCQNQKQGRGRGPNIWEDSGEGQVFLTFSIQRDVPPHYLASLLIGLFLQQSLEKAWPHPQWRIKPPNDMFLSEKKVGGLLIEVVHQAPVSRLIVGLGINLYNHPEALPEAGNIAATLGLTPEQSLKNFSRFLDLFYASLLSQQDLFAEEQLNETQRIEIQKRLMFTQLKKGEVFTLQLDGSIQVGDKLIPWRDF